VRAATPTAATMAGVGPPWLSRGKTRGTNSVAVRSREQGGPGVAAKLWPQLVPRERRSLGRCTRMFPWPTWPLVWPWGLWQNWLCGFIGGLLWACFCSRRYDPSRRLPEGPAFFQVRCHVTKVSWGGTPFPAPAINSEFARYSERSHAVKGPPRCQLQLWIFAHATFPILFSSENLNSPQTWTPFKSRSSGKCGINLAGCPPLRSKSLLY
jgi:hypothetical protein